MQEITLDLNAELRETPSSEPTGPRHTELEHQEGCHPARACGVPDEIGDVEQDEINLMVDPQAPEVDISDPRNDDDYDSWEYGTEPLSHKDLADKIIPLVPEGKWGEVQQRFVTMIVDQMPAKILHRLTGDHYGFDKAEEILTEYYCHEDNKPYLIEDALRYLGDQVACYELDLICSNE